MSVSEQQIEPTLNPAVALDSSQGSSSADSEILGKVIPEPLSVPRGTSGSTQDLTECTTPDSNAGTSNGDSSSLLPDATPQRPTLLPLASRTSSFMGGSGGSGGLFSPGTIQAGDEMIAQMRRQPSTPMMMTAVHLTIPENMQRLTNDNVKLQKKESLGKGGFAEVILGEAPASVVNPANPELVNNPNATEKVAVKVMDKGHVSRSAFMNLQQEVDICAELRHRCLINTHGIYETADKIFIVMDLAGGGELFKYIKKFGLEDMPLVAPNFIGEVILGLEFMLSQGIIHRDVKPENLLLTADYHVKLADFGCCCHIDDPNQKFAGTALYVAPETITTQKGSIVSDIWSLGCVLYQLFVGRPPFEGGTHYQVIDSIKKRKFEFPPYFPTDARDLVDRMLTTDPLKRIGANGYDEIKAHPFFRKVDWENIFSAVNVTHLNENFDKKWEAFLLNGSLTIKGQVPWSDNIAAEVENKENFHIHTSGSRVYHFNDTEARADLWAAKINETLMKCKERDRVKQEQMQSSNPSSPTAIKVKKK